jgi:hypothetical protein
LPMSLDVTAASHETVWTWVAFGFLALGLGLVGRLIIPKNRRDRVRIEERRRILGRLPEQWRADPLPRWLRRSLAALMVTTLIVGKATAGTTGMLAVSALVVFSLWGFSLSREAAQRAAAFEAVEAEAYNLPAADVRDLIEALEIRYGTRETRPLRQRLLG